MIRKTLISLTIISAVLLIAIGAAGSGSVNGRTATAFSAIDSQDSKGPNLRFSTTRLKNGVRMHYAEWGKPGGRPIILLHGLSDSWFSYSRVLPYFDPNWCVYILDQRGHGDSDRPATGYTMPDFAADVIAFMDTKGVRQTTLVGHSMGSFVAQQVALDAPDRIERLVLIGSAHTIRNDLVVGFKQEVDKLVDPVPAEFAREFQTSTVFIPLPAEFMDRVVAESLKLPARVWRQILAGLLVGDCKEQLDRIRTPTLIIWGDRDAHFSRSDQHTLAAALPNAILKIYAETGHATHWERPEQVAQDIKDFIAVRTVSGTQTSVSRTSWPNAPDKP
ncbi:MAG: alpha/beta hydrolase [Acidobacteria bacterium]|nr:alpha/beta hydrolase [Acidobacteriota bacterium]